MFRNQGNPQDSNRPRIPKNDYFSYKWRILDHFNRSVDRQMFHVAVQETDNHRGLLADKILQLYNSRFHSTRQDLIVDLAQDAMQFLDRRRKHNQETSQSEMLLSKATQDLMNRVFNTLLTFSLELNSLLGQSELYISASEPQLKKPNRKTPSFIIQGYLSTNLYRLVLDGRKDYIAFYIIPTDDIRALDELDLRYNAIARWNTCFDNHGRVYWVGQNGILTEDMLEVSCAESLRMLLGATQEALLPREKAQEEKKVCFDLLEDDPWLRDSTTSNFDERCEHELAEADERFDWKAMDDFTPNRFSNQSPVRGFQQQNTAAQAQFTTTGSYSITISTAYDSIPAGESQPRSVHTLSSDGTRTDSVPSLSSLLRESGQFSTSASPDAPVEDITDRKDALVFKDEPQEKKAAYDLKTEYFAAQEKKPAQKKTASSKRSSKKSTSTKGKKKR